MFFFVYVKEVCLRIKINEISQTFNLNNSFNSKKYTRSITKTQSLTSLIGWFKIFICNINDIKSKFLKTNNEYGLRINYKYD